MLIAHSRMKRLIAIFALAALLTGCTSAPQTPSAHADWVYGSAVYEMNVRQLTPEGTLNAAAEHLPRLKDLGVDVVWLMPIYPIGEKERKGSLGSYYAIRDYRAVNPEFGTMEDFDAFLEKAHGLGLKVILDWVANHTSPDADWVESKPAEWYYRDSLGNTLVEYDWTDIAKLNYEVPEVRAEMESCMRYWLDKGIDGFRCDVAYNVPIDFWQDVLPRLRQDYSDKYYLAEGENPELAAVFDASYAWELHHLLNDIAQGKAGKSELIAYVEKSREEYPAEALRLSFTSNHDENSWAGTEFARMGEAWKAMSVLCYTLPGSEPLLYTAQEIGYDHSFEFFEKDPVPAALWKEGARKSYTSFYAGLMDLYQRHEALNRPEASFELLPSADDVFAFRKVYGQDTVLVELGLKSPWDYKINTDDHMARVEPMNWWVGMKTPLQLLVKYDGISEYEIRMEDAPGIRVKDVHKAESPNYLFVDIEVSPAARPCTAKLVFTKEGESFSLPYEFKARREGSRERGSFTTADCIYLIMPDRFADGDPSIDSTDDTAEKADRSEFFGRHGGDIQGIIDHLDYIAELGATAIWNTPLLEDNEPRESYHGYACTDYYRIDSRFGDNELYRELVAESHKRGIKMIMDIVTNHCGDRHWWMEDLPFADWVHQWPEYTHSNCCFSMQNDPHAANIDKENMVGGWFDKSMVDMNLDNPYLLQYFKQWAVWWIEWADLDGLRVDTYPYNEKIPMSEWCKAVREEYPDINIVGEVWTNNVPQLAYWQAGNPNKDGFDSNLPSIMDFPLHSAICEGIARDTVYWDEGMVKVYDAVANDLYYKDMSKMMIFPSNHDTGRVGDVVRKSPARQKIVMTLIATLRGIPQFFSGDEMMFVSSDLSQGHGGLRVDFPGGWAGDRYDLFTPEGREACDVDMAGQPVKQGTYADVHDYVSRLFQWRKGATAIHNGETLHFLRRDNTYAYFRYNDEQVVFVYVNNSRRNEIVPWADYAEFTVPNAICAGTNVITGETVDFSAPVKMGPRSALVVEFKR